MNAPYGLPPFSSFCEDSHPFIPHPDAPLAFPPIRMVLPPLALKISSPPPALPSVKNLFSEILTHPTPLPIPCFEQPFPGEETGMDMTKSGKRKLQQLTPAPSQKNKRQKADSCILEFPLEKEPIESVEIQLLNCKTNLKKETPKPLKKITKWSTLEFKSYLPILRKHALSSSEIVKKDANGQITLKVTLNWKKIAQELGNGRTSTGCYSIFQAKWRKILPRSFYSGGEIRINLDSLIAHEKVNGEWQQYRKSSSTLAHSTSQEENKNSMSLETTTLFPQEEIRSILPIEISFLHSRISFKEKKTENSTEKERKENYGAWGPEELPIFLKTLRKLTYSVFEQNHKEIPKSSSLKIPIVWSQFASQMHQQYISDDISEKAQRTSRACYRQFSKKWEEVLPSTFYTGGAIKVEVWKKCIKVFQMIEDEWQEYKVCQKNG
ncbi:MAG: hypothetical protein CK425_02700 [Parachlamydia sp.]|nr:MAG: hypothetical protein CK425_02700 [Parachlamydia sp.]